MSLSTSCRGIAAGFLAFLVASHSATAQVADSPSMVGTTWSGSKPFGKKVDYFFAASGALIQRNDSGIWVNAIWRQSGADLEIEMNNKFATFRGTVNNDEISGEFANIRGQREPWAARRLSANDSALAQTGAARPTLDNESREPLSSPAEFMEGFVPTFSGDAAWGNSSVAIQFRCASTRRCEWDIVTTDDGGKKRASIGQFDSVRAVADIRQERLSLQYARRNRFETLLPEETLAIFARMKPLLESESDIDRCVDLSRDGSTRLCKVEPSPWKEPAILLFVSRLEPCQQRKGFCGASIFPLFAGAGVNR